MLQERVKLITDNPELPPIGSIGTIVTVVLDVYTERPMLVIDFDNELFGLFFDEIDRIERGIWV